MQSFVEATQHCIVRLRDRGCIQDGVTFVATIRVSGAGAGEVNVIVYRFDDRPQGPYAQKQVHCNYHWAMAGYPNTIIFREQYTPHQWGL